jgi:hypothetical protein
MKTSTKIWLGLAILFLAIPLLFHILWGLLRLAILFGFVFCVVMFFMSMFTKNSRKSKKIFLILLFIGLSAMFYSASAQSNFEYLQTNSKETSRLRPNLYYTLPLEVKGYSFLELYLDGKNYFGQTFLTKDIKGIFGVEVHAYYSSFFEDYIGVGPIITLPTKKSTIFTLSFMPAFMNYHGKYLSHYLLSEFVFFKEFKIPSLGTWRINSFGIINLGAKGGPAWEYGEAYLEKPIWKLFIGVGADLFCNTKWYPDPNWGVKLGYNF